MDILKKITHALKRISDGHAPMRIPAEETDVDIVLNEARQEIIKLRGLHVVNIFTQVEPCPWPEDIWTMTIEEYVAAIPDTKLRTAISGLLMRMGWNSAMDAVKRAIEKGWEERGR